MKGLATQEYNQQALARQQGHTEGNSQQSVDKPEGRPLTLVADENMAWVREFFSGFGELRCLPGRTLTPDLVHDADILLVRSVTRVDQQLLQGSRVRFVGSATIGEDHLDRQWLEQQGIRVVTAPGCNARSVVEYVLATLCHLQLQGRFQAWEGSRFGVVGLGNVGFRLATLLQALGLQVVGYDPFVSRPGIPALSLAELLRTAQVISLHTPLTRSGDYPTWHLLNADTLADLAPGSLLLNSGRGAVIDNRALQERTAAGVAPLLALDVWEDEPAVDKALAARVDVATPHIAGYSLEGKSRGTEQVYQQLCNFLGMSPQLALQHFLPAVPAAQCLQVPEAGDDWQRLAAVVCAAYPIQRDDQAFRASLATDSAELRAQGFDRLRKQYWPRREFAAQSVAVHNASPWLRQQLAVLGFQLQD